MSESNKRLNLLKKEMVHKTDKNKLNIDLDAVQNIVSKMKHKNITKGGHTVIQSHLKELRDIISEGKLEKLNIDTEAKLVSSSSSKIERSLVKFYAPFKFLINGLVKIIIKNNIGKKIEYNIYSANIKRSLVQHLVISIISAIIVSFIISLGLFVILTFINPLFLIVVPFIFILFSIVLIVVFAYIIPKNKAKQRGVLIDTELPFALRHLSTELQAGIGLYKTLKSIAKSDYGVLSEEINKTIIEIENGTDTKTALRHTALRSQSKSFNIALFHIVRTLTTGGNLAETINGVADSVSFDLMESAKAFGEKMNFFGIIFIFVAIVLPVFVAILGAIANAPLGQNGELFLPGVMTPGIITVIYLVIMPIIFVFLIFYIKMIEPKM